MPQLFGLSQTGSTSLGDERDGLDLRVLGRFLHPGDEIAQGRATPFREGKEVILGGELAYRAGQAKHRDLRLGFVLLLVFAGSSRHALPNQERHQDGNTQRLQLSSHYHSSSIC